MSEDEIRRRFSSSGPRRARAMEYVTDSGKDALGILYEDIGPSLEKEDKLVAVASEALAQINAGGSKSYGSHRSPARALREWCRVRRGSWT